MKPANTHLRPLGSDDRKMEVQVAVNPIQIRWIFRDVGGIFSNGDVSLWAGISTHSIYVKRDHFRSLELTSSLGFRHIRFHGLHFFGPSPQQWDEVHLQSWEGLFWMNDRGWWWKYESLIGSLAFGFKFWLKRRPAPRMIPSLKKRGLKHHCAKHHPQKRHL